MSAKDDELLKEYTSELSDESRAVIERWLARGDGVAVYENGLIGDKNAGRRQFVSFGSNAALLPGYDPPARMPDIGTDINWRYTLKFAYRRIGEAVESKDEPSLRVGRVSFAVYHSANASAADIERAFDALLQNALSTEGILSDILGEGGGIAECEYSDSDEMRKE